MCLQSLCIVPAVHIGRLNALSPPPPHSNLCSRFLLWALVVSVVVHILVAWLEALHSVSQVHSVEALAPFYAILGLPLSGSSESKKSLSISNMDGEGGEPDAWGFVYVLALCVALRMPQGSHLLDQRGMEMSH